jgi:hypothetical protein
MSFFIEGLGTEDFGHAAARDEIHQLIATELLREWHRI